MIYKQFQDISLSSLGFGAMRLPVIDGDNSRIDEAEARKMVDAAMAGGINYYDTAWGYHDGNSELVMGRILAGYPRDSFYIATKFPGYDPACCADAAAVFEKQLQKLQMDHVDFYLFHNVTESNIDAYMDEEKYGIHRLLMQEKAKGRIRHLGFSCHGNMDTLKRFLEAYGKDMEFCQLQINYLDWTYQNGREKVELLNEWHIPVWIMEPVRGGSLAGLAPEYESALNAIRPDESIPAWAFRFIQSLENVGVTLSGMSNMAQVEENLRIFSENKPLDAHEMSALLEIAGKMLTAGTVPCTACRYCTSYCRQELDIPSLLELYNEYIYTGGSELVRKKISSMPEDKQPKACLQCRSCESVCPQQIHISEILAELAEKLG